MASSKRATPAKLRKVGKDLRRELFAALSSIGVPEEEAGVIVERTLEAFSDTAEAYFG
jgi:hypothetical protein